MEEGGIMMAEAHEDGEIFVYTGGDQFVPMDVVRVRIAKSVKIIPERAFHSRRRLIYVEFHDGIETIGKWAFQYCYSLRSIKLLGVKVIEYGAFTHCSGLKEIEFGVELETIEDDVFQFCTSLRTIIMPSVRNIGKYAFGSCRQLTDLDLPDGLETIGERAFQYCLDLNRIAIPLDCMIVGNNIFYTCPKLATVDLVGGIHNTIASLYLERWRNEMMGEINRINQVLPNTLLKTSSVQQWIRSVIRQIGHYKTQHKELLKDATTLLELALWKATMNEKEEDSLGEVKAKKIKLDMQSERSERRITSGANIVIKNVLPYLELK